MSKTTNNGCSIMDNKRPLTNRKMGDHERKLGKVNTDAVDSCRKAKCKKR